ncbi:MAG: carbohydrate ABC transporter permease [Clostridia bacterium]|nr:carbohydrate ABC transporter permease [Clostridia bacterium]
MKTGKKRLNRSLGGDVTMFLLMAVLGLFSVLPILLSVLQSFKPLNEFFLYPPRFFVTNPTMDNYKQLFVLMSGTWVPMTRYIFNTVFITAAGTIGNIVVCSLAAYPIARHRDMPGSQLMFRLVVVALMFNSVVTDVVNYMTMSFLQWINSYWAIIVPAWGSALGLFIMKQFIEQIPDSLTEAAHIDGAGDYRIFWHIIMPNVRPAWLTVGIFAFIGLWNGTHTTYVYSEELKSLPYALNQIVAGGISRAGTSAAVAVVLMVVPVIFFIFSQDRIVETMATSGMKE